MKKNQKKPDWYPLGEEAWQNEYQVMKNLKEQSPASREEAIQIAKKFREEIAKMYQKDKRIRVFCKE